MRTGFALLLAALMLAGCGGEQGGAPAGGDSAAQDAAAPDAAAVGTGKAVDGPVKVAFVANNPSEFWQIAKAGTAQAAEELGCEVEFKIPADGSAQTQQQIVEDLIARGVSGIAISPCAPEHQTEMLNRAAAQVNLITQDSDAPQSDRACYIGTNNYEAGTAAGELLKEVLPEGGEIMLFVGSMDAQNARDRKKGIEEAIEGTDITIIDTRTDRGDRMQAIANVQDGLVANPGLDCLVGLWSYNGPAILNGVRDSGKLGDVSIVCFDEEDETLQGIKDGHIYGTIVQQPYEFGYQSVYLLTDLAKGDTSGVPEDQQIFIPVRTIKQHNVDEFISEMEQLLDQS